MTKNKTLAVVLVILFVLALLIVLGQSVFRVGKVELVAHTTTHYLSTLTEDSVLSGSKLDKGKSVFLLDRDDYKANLEASQPYIQVLAIEVVWPNTVKFHYAERVEIYALQLSDGYYAYLDENFKVLRVSQAEFNSTQQNCILLNQSLDKTVLDVHAGDFLNKDDFADFVGLVEAYASLGYSLTQMESMISSLSITTDDDGRKLNIQTFLGVNIQILNSAYHTTQKVSLAYQMMSQLTESERARGTIYVFKNNLDVLETRYIA